MRELDRLHKDSYLCNQERSSDSVTFGHFFQNLVTFGHLFRLLFEYTEDYFNQLRVIAFDSYQEYTIATDILTTARGTQKSIALAMLFGFLFDLAVTHK